MEQVKQYTLFDPPVFTAFVKTGEIVEVRHILGKHVESGYFDNHKDFCNAVHAVDKRGGNVYYTLQVIDPRLLGRAYNRLKQGIATTSDNNVLAYRWLPIDIDPARPSGVSSGDSELKEAYDLRERVTLWIKTYAGLSNPVRAMSGNGYHLLYRLPDLPITEENKNLIKGMLVAVDVECSTSKVKVDTAVFNPARIWKLYGTTARKGDEIPAVPGRDARPHRKSYIESLGDNCDPES